MRSEPVTSDWQVAKAMVIEGDPDIYGWTSAEIAANLNITVFQITARLKGMQGRNLVDHIEGYWQLTDTGMKLGTGPEPPKKEKVPLGERVYRTPTGGYYTPGVGASALPDDSAVPRTREPMPRLRYIWGPKSRKWGIADSHTEVFIDVDGTEWVRCAPMELAELIREFDNGLMPMRMRRRNGTTVADKKITKEVMNKKKVDEYNKKKAHAMAQT